MKTAIKELPGVAHATTEPPATKELFTFASLNNIEAPILSTLEDCLSYADAMAVLRGGEANELRDKIRTTIDMVNSEASLWDAQHAQIDQAVADYQRCKPDAAPKELDLITLEAVVRLSLLVNGAIPPAAEARS